MKYAAVLSVLFAATAVLAGPNDIDITKVDPCIRDCCISAATAVGCDSPLNAGCICGDKKADFTGKALACLQPKCADKIAEAAQLENTLCS